MLRTALAVSLTVSLAAAVCACGPQSRVDGAASTQAQAIVNGGGIDITDRPFQVRLQLGDFLCGGSILSSEWILTAQHCVDAVTASQVTVMPGVTFLSDDGQQFGVDQIVRFPGYNGEVSDGRDVALLHLSQALQFTAAIQPIALVSAADVAAGATQAGVTATASGWGDTQGGGDVSDHLLAADMPIRAESQFGSLTEDQMFAGDGTSVCQGDSGGPLTVQGQNGPILVGVASWVIHGCPVDEPGAFARVSSFIQWIADTTGIGAGGCPANAHAVAGGCECDDGFNVNATRDGCTQQLDADGCPAHSTVTADGQSCLCDDGFVVNAASTACVAPSDSDVCGAHAHVSSDGNQCLCDANFHVNATQNGCEAAAGTSADNDGGCDAARGNWDCGEGFGCVEGACVQGAVGRADLGESCRTDGDCDSGLCDSDVCTRPCQDGCMDGYSCAEDKIPGGLCQVNDAVDYGCAQTGTSNTGLFAAVLVLCTVGARRRRQVR